MKEGERERYKETWEEEEGGRGIEKGREKGRREEL